MAVHLFAHPPELDVNLTITTKNVLELDIIWNHQVKDFSYQRL